MNTPRSHRPALSLLALAFGATLLLPSARTAAQSAARRLLPAGEVTGLEMGLEGSLRARPGGTVRLFVSAYEVLRRRDLRPADGAVITVTASFDPTVALRFVADEGGRSVLMVPLPEDLPAHPVLRVDARTPRGGRRVFTVPLEVTARHRLELFTDRGRVAPGGTIAAFGRLIDVVTGLPAGAQPVTVSAAGDADGAEPAEVVTDDRGFFTASFTLPVEPQRIRVEARMEGATAARDVDVVGVEDRALDTSVTVSPRVAAPGATVRASVRVRDALGRPLRGARVQVEERMGARPPGDRDSPENAPDGDPGTAMTDASGRASVEFRAPTLSEGNVMDVAQTLLVVHPGLGSSPAVARFRVSPVPFVAAFAVAGGALVPELPGRVFLRLVTPTGAPLATTRVSLEVPRLGGVLSGTTDADGVVVLEGTVAARASEDDCGGPTATSAVVTVGPDQQRLCLPVDPDATLVVAAPAVSALDLPLAITLHRRTAVSRRAIEVTAMVRENGRLIPVARTVAGATANTTTLDVPTDARGALFIRARPLLEGGNAARGGGLVVYRGARPSPFSVEADESSARTTGAGAPDATTALFARPLGTGEALRDEVEAVVGAIAGALSGHTALFLDAELAARTPRDVAASVVLRDGAAVAEPLPESPIDHGLLRDPWRTRARFVRGRIGRLMRAVETFVDAQPPEQLEDVTVVVRGRHRFNSAILDGAVYAAGLGDEMVAGLDGEPLTIDGLADLDPSFTYDNVARRITRERLLRVLVMMRDFVRSQNLDTPWARRGDPAEYLRAFLDDAASFEHAWPDRAHLFDAWGRPFVLRPVRSRARTPFIEPVPGWELVSGGPDGRVGNGDDVFDPLARILPSRGVYPEAVGEDELVARLSGVVIGRATVESLAELFGVSDGHFDPGSPDVPRLRGWDGLPAQLVETRHAFTPLAAAAFGVGAEAQFTLPTARQRYEAVGLRFYADGSIGRARRELEAGLPHALQIEIPTALRPGEDLSIDYEVVALVDDAPGATLEVEARGGAVTARVHDGTLRLIARRPGMARLRLRLRAAGAANATTVLERRVRVVPPGSLRAVHAGTVAAPRGELELALPDGATALRSHVVIGTSAALAAGPLFAASRERHPFVRAWATVMAGGTAGPALLAKLSRRASREDGPTALEVACAHIAWAGEPVAEGEVGREGWMARLPELPADEPRARAAVLLALSSVVPRAPTGQPDRLGVLLARLREDGFRTLGAATDQPAVMARMAAALLLVDPADASARALLGRARGALEEDDAGRRWVPGNAAHPGDALIGTLALALAARQAGDDALADELSRSVIGRLYLAPRLGQEGYFWVAAAGLYGALGVAAPESVRLSVDGRERDVALHDGVAIVSVPATASVVVSGEAPVWVRSEGRYLRRVEERDDGGLSVRLEGSVGSVRERASFELSVLDAGGEGVEAPVVEVMLPGNATFDAEARRVVESANAVTRVEGPDAVGLVRIHLTALLAERTHHVPLPVRWLGAGRSRGFAIVAYDASTPWRSSGTPPRDFTIRGGER